MRCSAPPPSSARCSPGPNPARSTFFADREIRLQSIGCQAVNPALGSSRSQRNSRPDQPPTWVGFRCLVDSPPESCTCDPIWESPAMEARCYLKTMGYPELRTLEGTLVRLRSEERRVGEEWGIG